MDKKLGVYICGGCGIGESVDTPKIAKAVATRDKAPCAAFTRFSAAAKELA